jgi:hypothetical protein
MLAGPNGCHAAVIPGAVCIMLACACALASSAPMSSAENGYVRWAANQWSAPAGPGTLSNSVTGAFALRSICSAEYWPGMRCAGPMVRSDAAGVTSAAEVAVMATSSRAKTVLLPYFAIKGC